ncbi:MAG: MjaI family restriction endonuclease [Thermodesulfovibrio sp.]|nr:MjaI family restriction endonuclease [Thermodesulfovibrio sp.]
MAKEWILNMATNRWGLNKKNNVGPVSSWIRGCAPKTVEDWRRYYYNKLSEFLKTKGIELSPEEYLQDIGRKLYVKITEIIHSEVEEITEEDCIEYIESLVIERTYEGYSTEIKTIYGKLERELGIKINPAPDEWDRLYNVDFYIEVNNKCIGLQIKPISYEQTPEVYKWKEWLSKTHKKFEKKFDGKVFIVFSIKRDNKKDIYNKEVIKEIREEIKRLKGE